MEKRPHLPEWLKNFQENSWEVEILISGGAIFSLFQVSDFFLEFAFSLKINSEFPGTDIFIILGMTAIKILTVGFFSHLFLRALWVGMICINYVFPSGISDKTKMYAKPFKNRFSSYNNLYHEIKKIDKASGLVMFFSVLSFVIVIGLLMLTITFITIPLLFISNSTPVLVIGQLLIFLYVFDLLFFGVLRKVPYLTYVIFPVFWIADRLSFRLLYEKPLQLMSSNLKRKYAYSGFSLLLGIAILLTYSTFDELMHWPKFMDPRENRNNLTFKSNHLHYGFYRDELEKNNEKARSPTIQSQFIHDGFLNVFTPYMKAFDVLSKKDTTPLFQQLIIDVNKSKIENVVWYQYQHPQSKQLGAIAIIDISDFERGKHQLNIYDKDSLILFTIPFWKDF